MKTRIFAALVLAFLTIVSGYARESYAFVQRDTTLYLDVYQPAAPANGYTVVFIFGGGFLKGSRLGQWNVNYCTLLSERGYTAVAIDYRLGLKGKGHIGISNVEVLENAFYMAAEDCSAAIAYLVLHADELHIDPAKIILCGSSAGAVTALMTDYGRCNHMPYTRELPAGWKPAGVVSFSGAIYSTLRGLKWAETPAPTMLWHGTVDKLVTYHKIVFGRRGFYGADPIAKQLEKNNFAYCIVRCRNLGHEVCMFGPKSLPELDDFVQRFIAEPRPLHIDITLRDDSIQPTIYTTISVKQVYKQKLLDNPQ